MKSTIKLLLSFALAISFVPSFSQEFSKYLPEVNGVVHRMTYDSISNRIYTGGFFDYAGYLAEGAFKCDSNGVAPDFWPRVNGYTNAIISDGLGGYYIGGEFTRVGLVSCKNTAHVLADGSVDTSFKFPVNGVVNTLAMDNTNRLIAGGNFGSIPSGVSYGFERPVQVNYNVPGMAFPEANDIIQHIIPDKRGGWFVGGAFTQIASQSRSYHAHLDSNFNLTAWNPVIGQAPSMSVLHDSNLFITSYRHVYIVNAYTGIITDSILTNGDMLAVTLSGDRAYISGFFTEVKGLPRKNLACYNYKTKTLTSWNPSIASSLLDYTNISTLLAAKGKVYIAGLIERKNYTGNYRPMLVAADTITGAVAWQTDSAWSPYVNSVVVHNDSLFIGGHFDSIGGYRRSNFAILTPDSGKVLPLIVAFDNDVSGIFVADNKLYLTGIFTRVDSVARKNFVCLSRTDFKPDHRSFLSGGNTHLKNLYADKLIFSWAGDFNYGIRNLAAYDLQTQKVLIDWNPDVNGPVKTVLCAGNRIYAGGKFSCVGGATRNNAFAINEQGALLPWNPNLDAKVKALAYDSGYVYIAGDFRQAAGISKEYVARFDTLGVLTSASYSTGFAVNALAIHKSILYTGVGIDTSNGLLTISNPIKAFNKSSGALIANLGSSWSSTFSMMIYALKVMPQEDRLVALGGLKMMFAANDVIQNAYSFRLSNHSTYYSWRPFVPGEIYSIDTYGSSLLLGGNIRSRGKYVCKGMFAVDATTHKMITGLKLPNEYVYDFALDQAGTTVYYSAENNSLVYLGRIKKFNLITGARSSLATTNKEVWRIALQDSMLYLFGAYTRIADTLMANAVTKYHLGALNIHTRAVSAWNPISASLDNGYNRYNTLTLYNNRVYIGGYMSYPSGVLYRRAAWFDKTTGALNNWNIPTSLNEVEDILIHDSDVYITSGTPEVLSYRINTNTRNLYPKFSANTMPNIHSMAFYGTDVYYVGNTSYLYPSNGLVRMKLADSVPAPFITDRVEAGRALVVNGHLIIDGLRGIRIDKRGIDSIFVEGTSCLDSSLRVHIHVSDSFGPGNKFMVELSDSSGLFSTAQQIGSIVSSLSCSINVHIPASIPSGNNYRIRVRSELPGLMSESINFPVKKVPAQIPLSGSSFICAGKSAVFSTRKNNGSDSINWSIPPSWSVTGTQGDTVIFVTPAQSGAVSVVSKNTCGSSASATIAIAVTSFIPSQPVAIHGRDSVCSLNPETYSADSVGDIGAYLWTFPSGWTILNGQGSRYVTVVPGMNPGNVSLLLVSPCDSGPALTKPLYIRPEPSGIQLGVKDSLCRGKVYTMNVTPLNYATGYVWTLPSGWSKILGDSTSSLTLKAGNAPGLIKIKPVSVCGVAKDSVMHIPFLYSPAQPPASLSGPDTVCRKSEVMYTAASAANIKGYIWTVPTGWNILSGQGSDTLTVQSDTTNGMIGVRAIGICDTSSVTNKQIGVRAKAPAPVMVSGMDTVCRNMAATYLTQHLSQANGFIWSLPGGWQLSGGQNTRSIDVITGNAGGNISVSSYNACDTSAPYVFKASIRTAVALPVAITGPDTVCGGSEITYSVAAQPGATAYEWILSPGFAIIGGANTREIKVRATFTGIATIGVKAISICDTSAAITKNIMLRSGVTAPVSISGPDTICRNSTVFFEIAEVPGVSGYLWQISPGWNLVAQKNTVLVTTAGNAAGTLQVATYGMCDTSVFIAKKTTVKAPAPAPQIQGPDSICHGSVNSFYVPISPEYASWLWRATGGLSITSDSTLNTIHVTGTFAGTISVTAYGVCDTPLAGVRTLGLKYLPQKPLLIAGPDSVAAASVQSYRINRVPGAASYRWHIPADWTFAPGSQTDTLVTVNTGNQSGVVYVRAQNECGFSDTTAKFIQVKAITGLEESAFGYVSVFPNPAAGFLNITGEQVLNSSVRIYNVLGSLVYEGYLQSTEPIGIGALLPGTYTLQLQKNNKFFTCKLVIIR